MTDHSLLQALVAQSWQLAALAIVVALCVRYAARNRPHLAHALWLVVLLKCVTPPVWHSPIGVFSWLSLANEDATIEVADPASVMATKLDVEGLTAAADGELGAADVTVDARAGGSLALECANLPELEAAEADQWAFGADSGWLIRATLMIWGAGVIGMTVVSAIRFTACWRRLRRSEVETHPELETLVARLTKRLRMRRPARLLVTDSRIGPAVIGLWRPTILLPACVVRGRAAAELEPIVAHELLHIRRGDLWVGLLVTVAQSVWWFHPLVWLAGRMIAREAERCCDEEVIGELRCDPSRYARSLLGVLEWKRILIPMPAVPGVRAVEITSRRLERIMTLGQGCRRRTPWWCWGIMLLVAALALPGSPLLLQGDEPGDEGAPAPRQGAVDRVGVSPAPAQQTAEEIEFPAERYDWKGLDSSEGKETDEIAAWSAKFEWNAGKQARGSGYGKPRQVWGVDDLLTMIEKHENVDRAEAKKRLWLRLLCEHRNAKFAAANTAQEKTSSAPAHSSPAALPDEKQATAEKSAEEMPVVDPDRKPFWRGDKLVLSEDRAAAKRTRAAIEQMRKFGFDEVEIEVRFTTAPLDTITAVSNRWTTLPMKRAAEVESETDTGREPAVDPAGGVASYALEKNLPVIFDVLDEARVKKLMESINGDRKSTTLQAPRVRVPNGQTAAVFDRSQTPFVVGFKDRKPQISVISEGTTVRTRPILNGDKTRLDFEIVFSGIRSVDEVKIQGPDGLPTTIQAPEVAQSRVAATVDVPLGQTVLIAGVKEVGDKKCNSPMAVLLTVKKATVEKVSGDKLKGEQASNETSFAGNAAVDDKALRAHLASPRPLNREIKGKPESARFAEDIEQLTAYYRSLGFFKVRVGRAISFDDQQKPNSIKFTIDEGPRYVVRNIKIEGASKLAEDLMREKLRLKGGDFFDQTKLDEDIAAFQETYANAGQYSVKVEGHTQFAEEANKLDLVYRVSNLAVENEGAKTADKSESHNALVVDPFDPAKLKGKPKGKWAGRSYGILGPVTKGGDARSLDPPTVDEVLRAAEKEDKTHNASPLLEEKDRKNVRLTIEPVATYVDPARVYPLLGNAQLHHARYKCTLTFDETKKQGWPVPNASQKKGAQEVFYVDHNHLHLVDEGAVEEKKRVEQGADVKHPSLMVKVHAVSRVEVGESVDFAIDLTNKTKEPTAPLVLIDRFDPGLKHSSGVRPVEHAVAAIAPGETRRVTLALRAAQAGKWRNEVDVRAGDVVLATGETTVNVLDVAQATELKAREDAERQAQTGRRAKPRPDSIITVTYAVADLIMPFPNPVTVKPTNEVKPLPQAVADYQPLIELITSTIAPESWRENGGECSVTTFPNNLSLVVLQTEKGHAEIAKLFKQLRENLDRQIVLDCRTVDDPDELFRLMKTDSKASKKTGLATLPPEIVEQAHRAAEAKGGRNLKLTVFNGQQLKATALQESRDGGGGYIMVQAMISPDKQTARLRIADSRERVRQPWQQEEMTVLECGSLLIDNARFHLLADLGVAPPEKDGAQSKPAYVLITPRVIDASGVKPKDKKPDGPASQTKKSGKTTPPKAVQVLLTDEDQRQLGTGVQVTKVLYQPNEEFACCALGPVETIVSTRLDPSVDPIAEARRRGTILAVIRMNADSLTAKTTSRY